MERETVIARLIGHVFGDGSIHKTKYYFIYTNSNNVLQQKVKELVIKTFGKVKYNVGTSIGGILKYQYPSRVGRFLSERGVPVGSKITQPTTIPEWIFKGDDKIKSSFLGAIFDDEGYFKDSSNSRQIVFKASKIIELRPELERYLLQIIQMLDDLGIKASNVKHDQLKTKKNGIEVISLRFWITGNNNFRNFREKITIFHPEKIKKLSNMI
jgi:intein/homing endonuclease